MTTTLTYYADADADITFDVVWKAIGAKPTDSDPEAP